MPRIAAANPEGPAPITHKSNFSIMSPHYDYFYSSLLINGCINLYKVK
jgi:hypothetical protein